MKIIASVAVSSDGCLDDTTAQRLVLSGEGDWGEVHALRGACDAILIGAETLRKDNPSLRVKGGEDITKVVVSASADIDAGAKFFSVGEVRKIVITSESAAQERVEALEEVATVVRLKKITALAVVETLSGLGVKTLMVEGGRRTLAMFFSEGLIDSFRMAVSPKMVGDANAPYLDGFQEFVSNADLGLKLSHSYPIDDMKVMWFERANIFYLKKALKMSRLSPACDRCYRVGAVVVAVDGKEFTGYTSQTDSANHAEEEAITKALSAGVSLKGAAMYASMEPCSVRSSKPESCSALIIRYGFSKVVFAKYEPSLFVDCRGTEIMRAAGIEVVVLEEFAADVDAVNAHLIK